MPATCFWHGLKRLPDHGWANALGAEVAHFLDLHEIEEGIILGGRQPIPLLQV